MPIIILFFICSLIGGNSALAQRPVLKNYTVTQGLPGNVVYDVLQDSKGYLWLATENGVSRFDGKLFRNYTLREGLADNEIFKIREDYKGRVWFLSYNGRLSYYLNGLLYNAPNNDILKRLSFNYMAKSLFVAPDSSIWISSEDEGIKVLSSNDSIVVFQDRSGSFNGVYEFTRQGDDVFALAPGRGLLFSGHQFAGRSPIQGRYLVSRSQKGREVFHYGSGQFGNRRERISFDLSAENEVLCFLKDSRSTFWTGTRSGLYTRSASVDAWEQVLKNITITSIQEDSEGNIWIGTLGEGVYMAPALRFYEVTRADKRPLPALYSLYSSNDLLYAGTDHGSVYVISTHDFSIRDMLSIEDGKLNKVRKIHVSPDGTIWCGTDRGIFAYENGRFLPMSPTESVKDMYIQGNSLFCATNIGISVLNQKDRQWNRLADGRATSLGHIGDQILWGALNGLNGQDDRFAVMREKLSDKRVTKILANSGQLIAGTYGEGVFGWTGDSIWHLSEKQGLRGNIVQDIANTPDGLWILSNKALNRVRWQPEKTRIISYSSGDGLLSDQLNAFELKGDTVYIATDKGLTFFVPSAEMAPGSQPSVFITSVEVNGLPFHKEKLSDLAYFENNLRFDFSGIDLASLDDVRFQYRLDKLDPSWVEADNNFALYRGLKPGKYVFQARVVSKHGRIGSETASIHLIIRPHFTDTLLFQFLLGLILLAGLTAAGYLFFKRDRERQRRKLSLLRLEHSALRSQMNPHFLFNTLNSIQQFVLREDKRSANRYLVKFATLIRRYLDNSRDLYISVAEELENLEMYIDLENLRMGDKVSIHIERPPAGVANQYIPSMLIQPLVENAFQHALPPIVREGGEARLDICFRHVGSMLQVRVIDNGPGFTPGEKSTVKPSISGLTKSTAIQSIHERVAVLNQLHGFKAGLSFREPEQGAGTEAVLVLPLLNELTG